MLVRSACVFVACLCVVIVVFGLGAVAGDATTPTQEELRPYPFLDFEAPGPLPGAAFSGNVQYAEPSEEAAHSGKRGLSLHFTGAEKTGGQYLAFPSDMAALAKGISFWLKVVSNPGQSTLTVTFTSGDYQTQWHHAVPLGTQGWQKVVLYAEDFSVGHPPDVKPDWRRNHWVFWQFNGPEPVTVYLDDVEFLVDPRIKTTERFVNIHYYPDEYFIYNTHLQVAASKSAPTIIRCITAFRRRLVGPASVLVNGKEFDNATLALSGGKVGLSDQEYVELTGSVANYRYQVSARLECEPKRPLTYRLSLDQDTYYKQGFEIDGIRGRFNPGPAGIVRQVEDAKSIILGSLSKRRLTIEPGEGVSAVVRRDDEGQFALDLTSDAGIVEFILSPPSEAIEISLATERYHNVYDVQDAGDIAIKALFRNNTEQSRWCNYKARMTDFEGQQVFEASGAVRIAATDSTEQLLEPDVSLLGFYKCVVEAMDASTGEVFRKFITLGVIQPVERAKPPDKSGKFGVTFFCKAPELAQLIARCGIMWSRDNIYHSSMEPKPGEYRWGVMDMYTSNALKAGLWTMPINGGWASWTELDEMVKDSWSERKRVNLDAWAQWWSEMATRYKGKVGAWEISNEIYGNPVELVVDLHRAAYEAIKEVEPDVPVVANVTTGYGDTVQYLKDFLEANGAQGCDVISAHPYTGYHLSPEQGGMRELGDRVNEIIAPYFDNPRQWWTEYAWYGDDEFNPHIPCVERDWSPAIISERAQAQYIIRAYLAGMAAGVERMFYFLDQDTVMRPMPSGLLREEGIHPALCAINTICRALEYTDFVQDVELQDDVELMVFRGADHVAAAVWCTATPERRYVLRAPLAAADVQVLEMMGNTLEFPQAAKEIGIPFDGSPAFIISTKLSPEALAEALSRARLEGGGPVSIQHEAGPPVSVGRVFLKPGALEVEVCNETAKPASGKLSVLPPRPVNWGLRDEAAEFADLPPGAVVRIELQREATLPLQGSPTLLRLRASGAPPVKRNYNLLFASHSQSRLPVDDDPATWGEPRLVLDTAQYTMSCVNGVKAPSTVWEGPQDLSARLWLRWDEGKFYIGLVVRDDVHRQLADRALDMWQGDSVQLGFDAEGNAPTERPDGWDGIDDSEWEMGLFQGQPELLRTTGPGGFAVSRIEGVDFSVRREGDVTIYVAAFPWEVLAPATGEEGTIFSFNFIANDDDGNGREGWLGITGGIGETKAPRLFRKVLLVR